METVKENNDKNQKLQKRMPEKNWQTIAIDVGVQGMTLFLSGAAFALGSRAANSAIDRIKFTKSSKLDYASDNVVPIKNKQLVGNA